MVSGAGAVQSRREVGRSTTVWHVTPAPVKDEPKAKLRDRWTESGDEPTEAPLPAEAPAREDDAADPAPDFDSDDPFSSP